MLVTCPPAIATASLPPPVSTPSIWLATMAMRSSLSAIPRTGTATGGCGTGLAAEGGVPGNGTAGGGAAGGCGGVATVDTPLTRSPAMAIEMPFAPRVTTMAVKRAPCAAGVSAVIRVSASDNRSTRARNRPSSSPVRPAVQSRPLPRSCPRPSLRPWSCPGPRAPSASGARLCGPVAATAVSATALVCEAVLICMSGLL